MYGRGVPRPYNLTTNNNSSVANHFAIQLITFLNDINHLVFHVFRRSRNLCQSLVLVGVERLACGFDFFKTFLL